MKEVRKAMKVELMKFSWKGEDFELNNHRGVQGFRKYAKTQTVRASRRVSRALEKDLQNDY